MSWVRSWILSNVGLGMVPGFCLKEDLRGSRILSNEKLGIWGGSRIFFKMGVWVDPVYCQKGADPGFCQNGVLEHPRGVWEPVADLGYCQKWVGVDPGFCQNGVWGIQDIVKGESWSGSMILTPTVCV